MKTKIIALCLFLLFGCANSVEDLKQVEMTSARDMLPSKATNIVEVEHKVPKGDAWQWGVSYFSFDMEGDKFIASVSRTRMGYYVASLTKLDRPYKYPHGTLETYGKATKLMISYTDSRKAIADCQKFGFKVTEDYQKGSFLVCEYGQDTTLQKLIDLANCESITYVRPSLKMKAID